MSVETLSGHSYRWGTSQTDRQGKWQSVGGDDLTRQSRGEIDHDGAAQIRGKRLARFADNIEDKHPVGIPQFQRCQLAFADIDLIVRGKFSRTHQGKGDLGLGYRL